MRAPVSASLLLASIALAACAAGRAPEPTPLSADGTLLVESSARLAPGTYLRPAGEEGAILLEGLSGVELDLTGVRLRGAPAGTDPDRMDGFGIVVRRCSNIVVRGGELSGYRGALVIEESSDVLVEGVRFEDNFRQRLRSTPQREDLADWLRPHENDDGEWLARYGAAISVTDSARVRITGCRARRGQNGLLLVRSEDCSAAENDFSFLSGWGCALYRSSENEIVHNRFDYCVRGFSDGVYWRGQDSAGILMFERCCRNLVAWNSATHGGDGLFLFGGNDLVEGHALQRGETDAGGSDANVFFRNDFSFAVANAWEGTFSADNAVLENRLSGSLQHGLWGGYSSRLRVEGNWIEGNRGPGIAVEHGQDLWLHENLLESNGTGVALWWDPDPQFVEGPFGAVRDTSSTRTWIISNEFAGNGRDLDLNGTRELALASNYYRRRVGSPAPELELVGSSTHFAGVQVGWEVLLERLSEAEGRRPGGRFEDVTFAPWNGRTPPQLEAVLALKPTTVPGSRSDYAPTLPTAGGVETIVLGEWGPWDFESGEPRPEPPVSGGLLAESRWSARWFDWSGGPDPREDLEGWRRLEEMAPLASAEDLSVWTDPWNGMRDAVGDQRFGLVAESRFALETDGRYVLEVLSDDGVRVLLDGDVVLENWTWHAPTNDAVELRLAAGDHRWELEYFQIDGAAALSLALRPVDPSPAPATSP